MKKINFSETKSFFDFPFYSNHALLRWKRNAGNTELTISLPYEAAYGMGEKFNSLNQKGKRCVNLVEEQFCHQGEKTYCSAPFFFTNTGFGLYVDTDYETAFHFQDEITVIMPANADLVLFEGEPERIISEYMSLFGKAKLPPKWAFGPWISANHWDTQEKAEEQIVKLQKYGFPATVLVLEAWSDEATFYIFNGARYTPVKEEAVLNYSDFDFSQSPWPDPKGMIEHLHDNNIHLLLWQIPVYKKQEPLETPNKQNNLDRAYAAERKLCVLTDENEPYQIPTGHWFAGSMIPDFTNLETERLWFAKRQYLLNIGVDGFKTDGGEFIYAPDLHFCNGSSGAAMKNQYAQTYTAAYSNFIGESRTLFSRAGYAGQHTTPILWAGDQQSENSELKSVLNAGLSAAMTGILFWGFDISGFSGPMPTLDLYRRATQFACFCPVMQWHSEPDGGQFSSLMPTAEGNNERSPWNLAAIYHQPDFIEEMRFWYNLRMNLLPYLYSTALVCVRNSRPMIRPLAYSFPTDSETWNINDEYLLGDSLLIAPVLQENANSRSVYLPKGTWYNLFTKQQTEGNQWIQEDCINKIPVYLRSGYGIGLNLNVSGDLGGDVGNSMDSYKQLHFLLAGKTGTWRFFDDLGNDFTLVWDESGYRKSGMGTSLFTVQVIQ